MKTNIIDGGYTLNSDKNWMSDLLAKERIKSFLLTALTKVREDERKLLAEKVERLRLDSCFRTSGDILDTVLQELKDK